MGSSSQRDPRLSRHTRFGTLDQLLAAAEAVQSLVEQPGWPIMLSLIDGEVGEIDAKLDGGRVLDSKSEYAHLCGRRSGLRAAPGLIEALLSRAERELERQRERHEGTAEPVPLEA